MLLTAIDGDVVLFMLPDLPRLSVFGAKQALPVHFFQRRYENEPS